MKLKFNSLLFIILFALTSCATGDKLTKTPEQKKAELFYSHGTSKLLQKDYREALKYLKQAYEINPRDTKILNNLGMSYYFLGQIKTAFKYLEESLDIDSKNSDALNNIGSLYFKNKEYEKSLKSYQEVLKNLTYQHQYRTHYNIGLIHLVRGEKDKAKENFLLANTQNQDYCPASYELGKLYLGEYRYNSALKWFKEASKGICYKNPEPIYMQAVTHLQLENYSQAKEKFQEVIERFSSTRYSTLAHLKLKKINSEQILEKQANETVLPKNLKSTNQFDSPSF
ncbi:tetratricopeptide repeat protein [Halobacteriovorax marinus]|uniref:tetratricopeptide repeat protein n=1 Tax=Halobacteriovorax marinus TaxID=97084 RepID=UPI003A95ADB6